MPRVSRVFLLILLILMTAGVGPAHARGPIRPAPDPNDQGCPQFDWPYYYYRHPVIFQEITQVGTLQFVGFGYADACKQSGKGQKGGTYSTLIELDGVWIPDILEAMASLPGVPVDQALPSLGTPGSNILRWDLPDMPERFQELYDTTTAPQVCDYPGALALVCPGIPRALGDSLLASGGFERRQDRFGNWRWFFPTSGDFWGAWFLSNISTQPPNPPENFYARHWATDMRNNHSDGGVYRVVLHPVDLSLINAPTTLDLDEAGEAIIPLTIYNQSTRNQLHTTIGWRLRGETEWAQIDGWRRPGETDWRPYGEKILLNPMAGTWVEVRLTGRKDGEVIDLMVNETRAIAEILTVRGDPLINNIQTVGLKRPVLPDLALSNPGAPGYVACSPGGSYTVTWTLSNDGPAAVTTNFSVSVTTGKTGAWIARQGAVTAQPGAQQMSAVISTGYCDDISAVTIDLNPNRSPAERTYSNNRLDLSTTIGASAAQPPLQTQPGNGGRTETLIVPDDCDRNPDLTSMYPCLNYPNLYFPGG
ncbi:MAG TPA: hypothetical protein VD973_27110 [Symbiobacteriaceae bacterium]|nr:hypothetical protein [Symbiobacteriaceae bacterium]